MQTCVSVCLFTKEDSTGEWALEKEKVCVIKPSLIHSCLFPVASITLPRMNTKGECSLPGNTSLLSAAAAVGGSERLLSRLSPS